jgi:hypothetical protein
LVTPPKETKTIPAADTVRVQSRGRRLPGAALPACLREAGDNKEYEGSQKSGHQNVLHGPRMAAVPEVQEGEDHHQAQGDQYLMSQLPPAPDRKSLKKAPIPIRAKAPLKLMENQPAKPAKLPTKGPRLLWTKK